MGVQAGLALSVLPPGHGAAGLCVAVAVAVCIAVAFLRLSELGCWSTQIGVGCGLHGSTLWHPPWGGRSRGVRGGANLPWSMGCE